MQHAGACTRGRLLARPSPPAFRAATPRPIPALYAPQSGRFSSAYLLDKTPAGGMYIRAELLRFNSAAAAAKPFSQELDPSAAGMSLAKQYYGLLSAKSPELMKLYRESSSVCLEKSVATGLAGVQALLGRMVTGTVTPVTVDSAQVGATIIVLVSGTVLAEGETNRLAFTQAFCIAADAAGPFIANELFQLNYG